ncbi:MAG TPA: hypothetical protein VF904_18605 [Anaeromyxobacteraceae bacterium]
MLSALATVTLLLPAIADGPPPAPVPHDDAESFCRYETAAAAAESDLLVSPELIGSFGWTHFTERDDPGGVSETLRPRLLAGMRYSVSGLYRGLLTKDRARAECARYRALSAMRSFVESGAAALDRPALERRVEVLRGAIPAAEALVNDIRGRTDEGTATVVELNTTELRLDELRMLLAQATAQLEAIPSTAEPTAPLTAALATSLVETRRVAEYESRLSAARGWDVSLRGGYEQVFGVASGTPVFGQVLVTLDPGLLWHDADRARAVEAVGAWRSAEADGTVLRTLDRLRQLRAAHASEKERLRQVDVLVRSLADRLAAAERVPAAQVRAYRNLVWFELTKANAERAYLEAHTASIGRVLGPEASAGSP